LAKESLANLANLPKQKKRQKKFRHPDRSAAAWLRARRDAASPLLRVKMLL
jgi:hypothetical protein